MNLGIQTVFRLLIKLQWKKTEAKNLNFKITHRKKPNNPSLNTDDYSRKYTKNEAGILFASPTVFISCLQQEKAVFK